MVSAGTAPPFSSAHCVRTQEDGHLHMANAMDMTALSYWREMLNSIR